MQIRTTTFGSYLVVSSKTGTSTDVEPSNSTSVSMLSRNAYRQGLQLVDKDDHSSTVHSIRKLENHQIVDWMVR